MVDATLDIIVEALARGETVKLPGLGTFTVREKRARAGRNPRTGVAAPISARRVLSFKPSKILSDAVNHSAGPSKRRATGSLAAPVDRSDHGPDPYRGG